LVERPPSKNLTLDTSDNQYAYTDKKENKIFPLYEEIQKGAVAKSYMTNGHLIYD
jgi:hypothetical protein